MLAVHRNQLRLALALNVGLEWAAMCPDEAARRALVQLVGEEMGAVLSGVIYAAEAEAGADPEDEIEHSA
ncbi:hypothetical protein [Microbulbifer sp. SAOS-129_SWC]|uniref:hypothetical protein n=1 Tax=Microbulbifer sp. SAOS-129_SWC TaxID=3145235 RepID=UPI003216B018